MKCLATLLAIWPFLAVTSAFAYEQSDRIWRFSLTTIKHDPASDLTVVPPLGGAFDMSSDIRPGVSFTYLVADHIGLSVATAWPFSHDLHLRDSTGSRRAGSAYSMPVTASAQYFLPKIGRAKPWLGVGVSYINFTRENVGRALLASADSMRLQSSTEMLVEAGLDWDIDHLLSLSFSIQQLQADTTVVLKQAGVRVDAVDMNLDPLIWSIGVSRRF
ncbi:MAG: OmpW family outer membrane protein [Alcanivoracaceae bacterium]|jgi:outer membrane protein|nr:OmpW family outer membrane protein [Alcanivoracaceae bacterium]